MAGGMIEYILPRHLQIIYEINERFLKEVRPLPRRQRQDAADVDRW